MSARASMTWNAKQRRWFKKYGNKVYCVSAKQLYEQFDCPATMRGSRSAANEWWKNKRLEVDAADISASGALGNIAVAYRSAVRDRKRALQIGDGHAVEILTRAIAEYQSRIDKNNGADFPETDAESGEFLAVPTSAVLPVALARLTELMKQVTQAHEAALKLHPKLKAAAEGDTSIKGVIARYMRSRKVDADSGKLSPLQWRMLNVRLKHFAKAAGESADLNSITGQTLVSYREQLLAAGRSDYFVNDYFSAAKRFLKWAWETESLDELPRNIASKSLSTPIQVQEVPTYSVQEACDLIQGANDRTKLFILLALNCGYQQTDIATLRPDEIDWQAGTITRKRSKTKKRRNSLPATYALWPLTLELLKANRSDSSEHVLLDELGRPLKAEALDKDGRYTRQPRAELVAQNLRVGSSAPVSCNRPNVINSSRYRVGRRNRGRRRRRRIRFEDLADRLSDNRVDARGNSTAWDFGNVDFRRT
jgi:integrase